MVIIPSLIRLCVLFRLSVMIVLCVLIRLFTLFSMDTRRGEIESLGQAYPGWTFGINWVARNSAGDKLTYWAYRAGVIVSAFSVASLRERIIEEERGTWGNGL